MDRRHRLTSSRDFARAMRVGRRATSGPVSVTVAPGEDGRPARVGITATRASGGSVQRNRAKRLLRESARAHVAALPDGCDIVLAARPGIAGRSFQDVDRAVVEGLGKLGVAC